ncbi:hypothetical protein SPI1_58 [Skermania phage SPI1]|nr:hypothetical protein SPI1_58 [Skermania phage SPI1]
MTYETIAAEFAEAEKSPYVVETRRLARALRDFLRSGNDTDDIALDEGVTVPLPTGVSGDTVRWDKERVDWVALAASSDGPQPMVVGAQLKRGSTEISQYVAGDPTTALGHRLPSGFGYEMRLINLAEESDGPEYPEILAGLRDIALRGKWTLRKRGVVRHPDPTLPGKRDYDVHHRWTAHAAPDHGGSDQYVGIVMTRVLHVSNAGRPSGWDSDNRVAVRDGYGYVQVVTTGADGRGIDIGHLDLTPGWRDTVADRLLTRAVDTLLVDALTHTWAYPATRDIVAVTDPERW